MSSNFSRTQHRLERLHRWLTLEVAGGGLVLGGLFFLPSVAFPLLFYAALAFTPYMLRALYVTGRWSWIVGFALFVGLPFAFAYGDSETIRAILQGRARSLLFAGGDPLGLMLRAGPVIAFYLYTWALRHAVGSWVEKLQWQRRWALEDEKRNAGLV